MRVLIADDDVLMRRLVECIVRTSGYEPVLAVDGDEALRILEAEDAPKIAIVDWMMPGLDGVEVCRRVRQLPALEPPYLILATGRDSVEDITAGLDSGADDYVVKPIKKEHLQPRLAIAARVVDLQQRLAARSRELAEAQDTIQRLHGQSVGI